jgi:2-methoxy-6-polyprenyl-1,4-benzoquinol methylase
MIRSCFRRQLTRRFLSQPAKDSSKSTTNTTTHFGYQTVDESEKEERVAQVFHQVAEKYDLMNDFMSIGVHRLWKNHFIHVLQPSADTHLLDVAGGTGDIAFRFLDAARNASNGSDLYEANVTVLDVNQSMLDVGKQRALNAGYLETECRWVCANAESLPFEDNSFDAYTIAFGIRNCTHIDRVLAEAFRVLKPGGRFMCLEFSHVQNPVIGAAYHSFSFDVIPVIGQMVAGDRDSYQYLVESIRKFPAQAVFGQMIRDAGFKRVEWEDLTFGIAAIHSGWKL